jgi:murein DD-endopeptidase MepM/ murein hydrolase activator NlpD
MVRNNRYFSSLITRLKKLHWFKKTLLFLLLIILIGFLIPQQFRMPVQGATTQSYSQQSFWYYPWGKSVTHKGVDIFAKRGTPVYAATAGMVVFSGELKSGGKAIVILGPKWRFHYYAHLDSIRKDLPLFVSTSTQLGTVGSTGNAAGKPPHLHYTMRTMIPYPWQVDKSVQGWKKMFFINPIPYLNTSTGNAE